MEKPARSQNTPGTDAAFDLLCEIAADPDSDRRYPDGTVLIPADSPDVSALLSRAEADGKPVTVVCPGESDELAEAAREMGFDPAEFGL